MTPELKEFLEDYLKWVEAGAPQLKPFDRELGLCTNAEDYGYLAFSALRSELDKDFPNNKSTPFNYSLDDYCSERGEMHLNEKRLNWVREKLRSN